MSKFQITREIGIDAGHRVTYHHSKCRSLHGHRYTIQATVEGDLAESGSTEGMAGGMDFGFLKDEMMNEIDAPCDHALILWREDPLLDVFVPPILVSGIISNKSAYVALQDKDTCCGKMYVIDTVPTAENLAAHWAARLAPAVSRRTDGKAKLVKLTVWETPNCKAEVTL